MEKLKSLTVGEDYYYLGKWKNGIRISVGRKIKIIDYKYEEPFLYSEDPKWHKPATIGGWVYWFVSYKNDGDLSKVRPGRVDMNRVTLLFNKKYEGIDSVRVYEGRVMEVPYNEIEEKVNKKEAKPAWL